MANTNYTSSSSSSSIPGNAASAWLSEINRVEEWIAGVATASTSIHSNEKIPRCDPEPHISYLKVLLNELKNGNEEEEECMDEPPETFPPPRVLLTEDSNGVEGLGQQEGRKDNDLLDTMDLPNHVNDDDGGVNSFAIFNHYQEEEEEDDSEEEIVYRPSIVHQNETDKSIGSMVTRRLMIRILSCLSELYSIEARNHGQTRPTPSWHYGAESYKSAYDSIKFAMEIADAKYAKILQQQEQQEFNHHHPNNNNNNHNTTALQQQQQQQQQQNNNKQPTQSPNINPNAKPARTPTADIAAFAQGQSMEMRIQHHAGW